MVTRCRRFERRALRAIMAAVSAALIFAGTPARAQTGTPAPAPAATQASEPGIPLELNKLEPITAAGGASCRVYFVVTNPDGEPFEQFRLDLILFGTDGVIARRVALDLGPLAPKKQAVRLFDLTGLPCDSVGKVLVNDVIACTRKAGAPASTDAEREACLDRLTLSSRAKAPLTK